MTALRRVYERAVLRPFAEQLVEAAGVQPREHVAELLPRSDMLALALASLAPGAAALPVREVGELDAVAVTRALALFADGDVSLAVAATSRMPVTLLAWPARGDRVAAGSPPPEHVIASAWESVDGEAPSALAALPPIPSGAGWDVTPVTDVCRFDSVEQLVTAACAWHDLDLAADVQAAVIERVEAALADRTGFDGTLRVPVTALLARSV